MYNIYINPTKSSSNGLLAFGILAMLAGIIILIEPMVLVSFIASAFILTGAFVIWIAWRLRKKSPAYQRVDIHW